MHDTSDEHILARILEDNDQLANDNRAQFSAQMSFALNIMSAPGAGKTSLLLSLSEILSNKHSLFVIEGDMVGDLDAQKLEKAGISTLQISTGRACHLDSAMIARQLSAGKIPDSEIIFIENVGNLVCPAEFPLGEHRRVVLLSITEGDDKPFKYPVIFRNCDAIVITKTDLQVQVDFSMDKAMEAIRGLNPHSRIFETSSKTRSGIEELADWISHEREHVFPGKLEHTRGKR